MDLTLIIVVALFFIGLVVAYWIGYNIGAFRKHKWWEGEMPGHRKDAVIRSRRVLGGQFSEQLAPYFPDFEFNPNECRFIGKPVDFLVFKGMDNKEIEEVVFVEVKSGKSGLSSIQKKLKDAIKNKRVKWREYRIPEDITEEKREFQ